MTPSARARLALEGLSVGDALGQCLFQGALAAEVVVAGRVLPPTPWRHSDDTAMADVLVQHLESYGTIEQDALAAAFAERYRREPDRGYGAIAHWMLTRIGEGRPWREVAGTPYQGAGSMGNGAAMRVAPVAAWYGDDLAAALAATRLASEVTHLHPEGIAGALAVTAACHFAWTHRGRALDASAMIDAVLAETPNGAVRDGLVTARALGRETAPLEAAAVLGDGRQVTGPDTVPFAVWCVATGGGGFEETLWRSMAGVVHPEADRDTVGAIVGGIVVLASGEADIPAAWKSAREPL